MPAGRPDGLNPRAPVVPVLGSGASGQALAPAEVQPENPAETAAEEAARAGGFHESSYELQHGLQVSESEWPDDVTVPGALGER
jgi:hypothetical protein